MHRINVWLRTECVPKPSGRSSLCSPSSGFSPPRGGFLFLPADTRSSREMKHSAPKQPICFGLIPTAISFEPGNDVRIQTHSYGFLLWPIELADFGSVPIENRRRVGKINVLVSFCRDGADVSLLLLCELPHSLSFHAIRQHEPK